MSFLSLGSVLASVGEEPQTLISDETASDSARSLGGLLADVLDCGTPICKSEEISIGRLIGHGTTMEVNEATWNGRAVAIKRMKLDNQAQGPSSVEADDRQIRRHLKAASLELKAMSHSTLRSHPNVVDLLAVSWQEEGPEWHRVLRPLMITELAWKSEPTLEALMKRLDHKDLGLKSSLVTDILSGLDVLHLCAIVHGDLKPENVLIFKDSPSSDLYTAKLSDFGFSQGDPDSLLSAGGTPYWNAPECLEGLSVTLSDSKTKKSRDIYSFGLLAYFIICGQKPFGSDSQEEWSEKEGYVRDQKLDNHVSDLLQTAFGDAVRLKPVPGRAVDFEIRLEDQDVLEDSIRKVNGALAAGVVSLTHPWESRASIGS
jgi:serine/threonine protein kinase